MSRFRPDLERAAGALDHHEDRSLRGTPPWGWPLAESDPAVGRGSVRNQPGGPGGRLALASLRRLQPVAALRCTSFRSFGLQSGRRYWTLVLGQPTCRDLASSELTTRTCCVSDLSDRPLGSEVGVQFWKPCPAPNPASLVDGEGSVRLDGRAWDRPRSGCSRLDRPTGGWGSHHVSGFTSWANAGRCADQQDRGLLELRGGVGLTGLACFASESAAQQSDARVIGWLSHSNSFRRI